jgi:hypothetical protein
VNAEGSSVRAVNNCGPFYYSKKKGEFLKGPGAPYYGQLDIDGETPAETSRRGGCFELFR